MQKDAELCGAPFRAGSLSASLLALALGAGCAFDATGGGEPEELGSQTSALTAQPSDLNPEKVLLVRDVSVVDHDGTSNPNDPPRTVDPCKSSNLNDGNRHWTFGYLMTQMAARSFNRARNRAYTASELATDWLQKWANASDVWTSPAPGSVPFNPSSKLGEQVQPDLGIGPAEKTVAAMTLNRWRMASCLQAAGRPVEEPNADFYCPGSKLATTALAMNKAPFRLLAIVNRPDLRSPRLFGEGNAGELRFVFEILDPTHKQRVYDPAQNLWVPGDGSCQGMDTTMAGGGSNNAEIQLLILEYAANKSDPKAYERSWEALNTKVLGSTDYVNALQAITDGIVNAGAAPNNANQSALIRIRTNTSVDDENWTLREFMIATDSTLVPVEVKQTPFDSINATKDLSAWSFRNESAIIAGTDLLPTRFPPDPTYTYTTSRFRGTKSNNQTGSTFWSGPGLDGLLRHKLSLATCNGCHSAETGNGFFHVRPRLYKQTSAISGFLSGVDPNGQPFQVADPVSGEIRSFAELRSRQTSMWNLIYR